jgi:hypothetical protein
MSIPLTASTEEFTPACMAEIEGAPVFTFRHARVLDRSNYAITLTAENIKIHGQEVIREKILSELRRLFEGEGLAQNITRLEAFWQADDEWAAALNEHSKQVIAILSEAQEGDKPELPPRPERDFPEDQIAGIELMLAQVNEHSEILNLMTSQNLRYRIMHPRILLRMLLVSTTLDVPLKRRNGVILEDDCEDLIEKLMKVATELGADPDDAVSQLFTKAQMSFYLSGGEEKNSSSPRSATTSPAQSPQTPSSGKTDSEPSKSSDPATSEADTGSISSE